MSATLKAQNLYYYQDITDVERTLIATAADGTGSSSLTNKVIYWDGSGNPQVIFVPSSGASTPRCAVSRDFAFFMDGVVGDLQKWSIDDGDSGWGIAAPKTAPTVIATGSANATWTANTVWSTFGLLIDSGNNIQQLTSINAQGTNTQTNIGTTGVGQPAWNQTPNTTTSDNTITWRNKGPIGVWKASTFFNEGHYGYWTSATSAGVIYDPVSNALYFNNQGGGGTSGSTYPAFTPTRGSITQDGTVKWEFLASVDPTNTNTTYPSCLPWKNSTYYKPWGASNDFTGTAVVEPISVIQSYSPTSNSFTQTLYLMACNQSTSGGTPSSGGTSAASGSHPYWGTNVGDLTIDGDIQWSCLGSKNYPTSTVVTAWSQGTNNFTVIYDGTNFQVCIIGGTTQNSHPTWGTGYGTQTVESGGVTWACLGPSLSWAASTIWFKPTNGFVAPSTTSLYGGALITDSNNNIQATTSSGKGGASAPSWNTVGTTTDGSATWTFVEAAGSATGAITLTTGRRYYLIFNNTSTSGMSDVSPLSASSGPLSGGQILLTSLEVSGDAQVDSKTILATADGGDPTTLYYVAQIPNATTTYSDNTSETNLLLGNIYQETDTQGNPIGIFDNTPPINGSFPTSHKGRIYYVNGPYLYFSKSLAEIFTSTGIIAGRYEECFPAGNALNISTGTEEPRGLLSDGTALYIGTERHVRRLLGDSPSNFSLPDVLFDEAGVLNQSCWKNIFVEGTTPGSIWVTPDFRCLISDFNTYSDIGTPIQATLNTINPNATSAVWAEFVSYGAYTFYCLALPTGSNTVPDTFCVYEMHTRKWYVWQFADSFLSGIFYVSLSGVPRFILCDSTGQLDYLDITTVQDRSDTTPVGITTIIKTSWLSLGDVALRKALNEIEVMTSDTANMTVTVEAASTPVDFASPEVVVANQKLIQSQFGTWKVYLVGTLAKDKFYRFTFTSVSNGSSSLSDTLLDYYSVEIVPVNRI